jgi:hypothetical protein
MRSGSARPLHTRIVRQPRLLLPHKSQILRLAASITHNVLRWHLALVIGRLHLTFREREIALDILLSMQGLADLALADPSLRARVLPVRRHCTATGTPAMKARGRKLLHQLGKSTSLVH